MKHKKIYIIAIRFKSGHVEIFQFKTEKSREEFIETLGEGVEYATSEIN